MFAKIFGTIWLILGLLWIIKPQMLRNRLKKKMTRKIRWTVFGFILIFGLSLLGGLIRTEGIFLKIVGLIGLVIVIKGLLLITSKTSEKLIGWWQGRPLVAFRILGLFIFIMGFSLLFFV